MMQLVAIKNMNDPYGQGYADCKEGKEFYPHYWVSFEKNVSELCHGAAMSVYDKGQYTLGWDAAIMGGAL
jgi:hypothetical protein